MYTDSRDRQNTLPHSSLLSPGQYQPRKTRKTMAADYLSASQVALVVKNLPANAGKRCRFDCWVSKMPWKRVKQCTPIFLPGESHGQRGAWRAVVHRVAKSWTRPEQLSTHAEQRWTHPEE